MILNDYDEFFMYINRNIEDFCGHIYVNNLPLNKIKVSACKVKITAFYIAI